MGACPFEHYALPTIDFVGGETQELRFHTYFPKSHGRVPFPLTHCTATFTVVDFLNKNGRPVIGPKEMTPQSDSNGSENILFVKLLPEDTKNLEGKFVYQIVITELGTGDTDIPRQGILLITRNISNHKEGTL